ncbi:MAG: SDR family NAD(P)-dependent oxidoreductase [Gammaproteobacteria bacterium]|jgi:short-subunit dehydrogenase|nr:SDR family NAD(P)-dependent oxidoreductase [Gammaproteobacteria bacterium]MBT7603513.1 SDR family NAD(P)-dependent oxidoreductase [Gammaproteobacteria bacterium]|tara:strand:- start:1701 stop:2501 length:801 start_codon:yes stop_codon:yes gene_type:complete
MDNNFFQNKIILINGATGGLGIEISKILSKEGARLILVGTCNDKLKNLIKTLGNLERHRTIKIDFTNTSDYKIIINKLSHEKKLDIMVNTVALMKCSHLSDITEDDTINMFNVNIISIINLVASLLKNNYFSRSCLIVNIGSSFGSLGYPFYNIYCATKFALYGFSESLNRELSDTDKKVIYIAPRAINTNLNTDIISNINKEMKNTVDSPKKVAEKIISIMRKNKSLFESIGCTEKIILKINSIMPFIIDNFFKKNIGKIKKHLR